MKIIEFLIKLNNGEIKENTIFYDKYNHTEYIYKPKSYAGIYPNKERVNADEEWFKSLSSGIFRLDDEIEIIEPLKEKITWNEKESLAGNINDKQKLEILARRTEKLKKGLNELIEKKYKVSLKKDSWEECIPNKINGLEELTSKKIKKLNYKYNSQVNKLELAKKIDEIIDKLNEVDGNE